MRVSVQESKLLINIALTNLQVNQTSLAQMLGVSAGQVSRWKNHNDYMSLQMSENIKRLCNMQEIPTTLVIIAGSIENAHLWHRAISTCAEHAVEASESGYGGDLALGHPLYDIEESVSDTLYALGVTISQKMTNNVSKLFAGKTSAFDIGEDPEAWETFLSHPIVGLVFEILCNVVDIMAFHDEFISSLTSFSDETTEDLDDLERELRGAYTHLAAIKSSLDPIVAVNAAPFQKEWLTFFAQKLKDVKTAAIALNLPLKVELMDLVTKDTGTLSDTITFEALGVKANIHPDVYMNELLVGMRVIHQVLPAILEKLGLLGDFELDEAAINCGTGSANELFRVAAAKQEANKQ